ncbi:disease resistance protein RPV1 [Cryptomeria japonica]|uniref:disease resistance protein RPV1 n=1 Tax=Cryptomeria japonica TaxID=3369 RepID=UPI0027DA8E5C|nr:disease resistance protein RPV1 [Cryptomeria japonica]
MQLLSFIFGAYWICYLHQRKNEVKPNEVEPYEQVLHKLEDGGFFSGSKMYNFDEQRVLFTYDGLNPSAKEAFLDICSYFSSWGWEWEKVERIVGWEEMLCLEEGALIKREGKEIKIHDLILTAGRNKSKDNRFNDAEAFSVALKNKERVSQIKGIWIESMKSPLLISAEELDAMSRSLRVLCMGNEAAKLITIKGKCGEQFDELRFLDVESEMCNLPVNMFNLNQLRYLSIGNPKEDVILSRSMNLPNLNVLEFRGGRIHGIAEIARLCSLKQLTLGECQADWISQCFTNLHHLQRLNLSSCRDLTELPESLVRLQFLQKLDLRSCWNLKQLPAGFGELTTLTELHLLCCRSLQELPRDLEKLTSLQYLNIGGCSSLLCLPAGLENLTALTSLRIYGCSSLTCLPHNLGGLMSALGSNVDFDSCSSLSELPEDIYKNEMVRSISLGDCRKLERLPSRFGELTYLQRLRLSRCESLQELCNDFHYLGGLTELQLNNCKSLSSLPLGFGNLTSLETLNLSGCDKLEELPIDFHCLVALKYLDLSECNRLCNLPDRFGEFGCLEWLSLSGCSKLVKLSDDFHLLRSLIRLDLSKCGSLAGEWMDKVGNIKSLWRLDIVGSERMIQRWMETKSQKERNLTVLTAVPQGREGDRAFLLLEGVLSKVFDEEGLLVDADERPFHSSSLKPQTPLIFIIDEKYHYSWMSEELGKNLQQLQSISKELQIIYVGSYFKSISSELAIPILAYTPDNSSFYHKLSALFHIYDTAVFRSTDELEENGLKCLSAWEDISSYMCNRVNFLTKTPLESNIELLNELLVTNETDYLLLSKNRQVKVAALQGKMILLLYTNLEETQVLRTSVVKEMYLKMQDSHNYEAELVWVPDIYEEGNSWEEFERVTANAPWPVVPNPCLIDGDKMRPSISGWQQKLPCVCVVDKKGRISKDNALPMIER